MVGSLLVVYKNKVLLSLLKLSGTPHSTLKVAQIFSREAWNQLLRLVDHKNLAESRDVDASNCAVHPEWAIGL
jgi:hypothetical protein